MTLFTNNDVVSGAQIFASDHNEQGSRIASAINGGLSNENINASAAIATSKLADDAGITTAKLGSAAVTTAKIAANAVTSTLLGLSNALDATNGVQSYSNAGTWGGTFYYINLGGIRMLWGISANKTISSPGTDYTVTLPTSFFSTIQTAQATPTNLTATGSQYASIDQTGLAASTTTLTVRVNAGITTTAAITLFVIGT